MSGKRYAAHTKFPKLFGKCYWGCFSSKVPDQAIVGNRDAFVTEFEIVKYVGNIGPKTCVCGSIFDHCELYKCKTGYVYIVSPYGQGDILDECARQKGFIKYKKLYDLGVSTYVKTFADKYTFNKYIRQQ